MKNKNVSSQFQDENVDLDILKKRAFNYRWAEVPDGVIPLTAADSDFPAAPEVREALIEYIESGYFSYTPKKGLPEFISSIASGIKKRKGITLDENMILPIDSAARGMYITSQAVLQPGDEVIIFDPVDYLFKESALSAGAVPILFPAKIKNNKIDVSDIEQYITPRTRMIGLCNPHNPLGALYSRESLDHLLTIAEKYDLYIMNDEIWSDIVFPENEFLSILSLDPERNGRVMTIYGFSKSFGLAGLRIGCIYCFDEIVFSKILDCSDVMTTAGGISSLSQIAGIACMQKTFYWLDEYIRHLTANRDYAVERINSIQGLSCRKPEATYLLFIDISKTGLTSQSFVEYVLQNAKLAVVPGTEKFFGPGAKGYIRLCFATSRGILEEALNRLEQAVRNILREKKGE
jgi:aspartate/methionine/tyrosine aminotransferase